MDPDILDHLGLVPRELGSVQLHVEPVVVVEAERRAYVTALLQPAFEGRLTGKLLPTALTATGDRAVAADLAIPLPVLDRQVLRWRFSFPLLAVPEEILFRVEAPIAEDAARIRAAWKLLDTVEQPTLAAPLGAGLQADEAEVLGLGVHMALGLALGHVAVPALKAVSSTLGGSVVLPEGPGELVRHAPPESLDGVVAKTVLASGAAAVRDGIEVVWKPGMDLPEAPPTAPWPQPTAPVPPQRASRKRPCPLCGNDVDVAEAERERQCTWCGAPWPY